MMAKAKEMTDLMREDVRVVLRMERMMLHKYMSPPRMRDPALLSPILGRERCNDVSLLRIVRANQLSKKLTDAPSNTGQTPAVNRNRLQTDVCLSQIPVRCRYDGQGLAGSVGAEAF
jgi:hypothetical protein